MAENPYQSSRADSHANDTAPTDSPVAPGKSVPRPGVGLAIAVIWNCPLIVVCYLGFTGAISEFAMNLLLACWALLIPVCALLVTYSQQLQRLLFTAEFENATKRPGLWGLVVLWTVISVVWIASSTLR